MKRIIRVGKGKTNKKGTPIKKSSSGRKKEKITLIQGKEMISVRIDPKTVIFVPKGTDKEKAKKDFIEKWRRDQGEIALRE